MTVLRQARLPPLHVWAARTHRRAPTPLQVPGARRAEAPLWTVSATSATISDSTTRPSSTTDEPPAIGTRSWTCARKQPLSIGSATYSSLPVISRCAYRVWRGWCRSRSGAGSSAEETWRVVLRHVVHSTRLFSTPRSTTVSTPLCRSGSVCDHGRRECSEIVAVGRDVERPGSPDGGVDLIVGVGDAVAGAVLDRRDIPGLRKVTTSRSITMVRQAGTVVSIRIRSGAGCRAGGRTSL
jgi:hypothetical protein